MTSILDLYVLYKLYISIFAKRRGRPLFLTCMCCICCIFLFRKKERMISILELYVLYILYIPISQEGEDDLYS